MTISDFIKGHKEFQSIYFKNNEDVFLDLIENGQNPTALFIGCSDSRVIPNLILNSKPGELFVVRNIGNFVPPFKPDDDFHGTAAAIEYAVNCLNVRDIIVCGHSDCGAIKSLFKNIDEKELPHVKKWLELGEKAKSTSLIFSKNFNVNEKEMYEMTEKFSIVNQIENLLTYPYIKERHEKDELFIHGWYYRLENGDLEYYDPKNYQFEKISNLKLNKPKL